MRRRASLLAAPDRMGVWLILQRPASTEALIPPGGRLTGYPRSPRWVLARWERRDADLAARPKRCDTFSVGSAAVLGARYGRREWVVTETLTYGGHLLELVELSVARSGSLDGNGSARIADMALDLMSELRDAAEIPWVSEVIRSHVDALPLSSASCLSLDGLTLTCPVHGHAA